MPTKHLDKELWKIIEETKMNLKSYKPEEVRSISLDNNVEINHIHMYDIIYKRAVMSKETYKKMLFEEVKKPTNWLKQLVYIISGLFNLIANSLLSGFTLILLYVIFNFNTFQIFVKNDNYQFILFEYFWWCTVYCFITIFIFRILSNKSLINALGIRNVFKEQIFQKL